MNCNEIHPLLHAYVDGELELMPSLEVERHLKACPACAASNRSLQALRSNLRHNDLAYRAPQSLRARLEREVDRPAQQRAPRVSRPWLWQWLAVGAAGFALLALVLHPWSISDRERLADDLVSSHVRSLMAGHLTDVASTDQHTVKPWFNGKIDFAPEVKDLAAQGFPLAGGRLDYVDGQTVAALVYQRNRHTINVFIWPENARSKRPAETRRGYSLVSRNFNGLHYVFVSDLNAKELGEFATRLTGQ